MGGTGGETERHRDLKRRAVVWAVAHGFRACALEVRLPRSGFRADVVAAAITSDATDTAGETAVFECKQSRSDMLRDGADERATCERLRGLSARRQELEQLVGAHLPNLRKGNSLFAACDDYDFDAIQHEGLRRVRREEARLQTKLFGGTKFARLRRYSCADRLYLVVSPGVLEAHEAPDGWGILVASGDGLDVLRAPTRQITDSTTRLRVLQAIAVAGTRAWIDALGIDREEIEELRSRSMPL